MVSRWILPAGKEPARFGEWLHPVAGEAPLNPQMECRECGYEVRWLDMDEEHVQCVLPGRHRGHPDDACPDEYVLVCPECRSTESFTER